MLFSVTRVCLGCKIRNNSCFPFAMVVICLSLLLRRMKESIVLLLLIIGIPTFMQGGDSIYAPQHQEKVYLHFDQSDYFLEETIWFKAYITDESNRPTDISRILYVELVSPEGGVVDTFKGKIENGESCGQLHLDSAYLSGMFEVRAYTRYMMNFGEDNYFSRVFPVYDMATDGNYHLRTMLDRLRPDISEPHKLTLRERIQKAKNARKDTLPMSVQRTVDNVVRHYNYFTPIPIRCDSLPEDLKPGQKVELVLRSTPNSTFSLAVCAEESYSHTGRKGDIYSMLFRDSSWVARSYRALRDFDLQTGIRYAPERGITVDGDYFMSKRGKRVFLSNIAISLDIFSEESRTGGHVLTDSSGRWAFTLDDFYGEKTASLYAVRIEHPLFGSQLRMHKWFSPPPRLLLPDEYRISSKNKYMVDVIEDSTENIKQLESVTVTAKKRKWYWNEVIRSLVHYSFLEEVEYYADHETGSFDEGINGPFELIHCMFMRYFYPKRNTRYMIMEQYDGDHSIPRGRINDNSYANLDDIKEIVVRSDEATCKCYDYAKTGFINNLIFPGRNKYPIWLLRVSCGIKIDDGYDYLSLERQNDLAGLNTGPHLGYMVCFIKNSSEERKAMKDLPKISIGPNSRITVIRGFSRPETFDAPGCSQSTEELKKDFRRTLYWNPYVKTDAQGIARIVFYNNNNCHSLHISAEGIGSDRNPMIYKEE